MTDREKAIVMAHTGICMFEGEKLGVFYQYLNELYGRPVYTHEWVTLDIKEKSKPDFLQLCKEEEPEQQERWIPQEYMSEIDSCIYTKYKCSNCGEISKKKSNYCPNCGAKMNSSAVKGE